jgi:hypothetical protein
MIHFSWSWLKRRPTHRRAPRASRRAARRPGLEQLECRQLLSGNNSLGTALPINPASPAPLSGLLGLAPSYYELTLTDSGRLTAEVVPLHGVARLSLLASDGTVLMQSDGQSAHNADAVLDLHLAGTAAGTNYYLEVEGLGGSAGSFALLTTYVTASTPAQPLPVGLAPWSVAAGDFNRDGHADLAVANFYDGSVSVYLGTGDGTFGPPQLFGTDTGTAAITAIDLNGDGKLDLVTTDFFENTVSVLIGNGDGTFQGNNEYAAGTDPTSLAVGDFTGSGKPDLAVADYGSNSVTILTNYGDGSFTATARYAVGANPYGVVAGDFTGNGKLDLAIANSGSNNLSILLGHGDGTFQSGTTVAVGQQPRALAAGDFNRDGKLDLAVANYGSNTLSILRGNGDGTFTLHQTLATGAAPTAIMAGDFNGDGRTDLAVANLNGATVSVFLGPGNGTFDPQAQCPIGSSPSGLAAADFTGGGVLDLAVSDLATGKVQVVLGKGDGTFQTQPAQSAGGQIDQVVSGDFTGNGRLDLAVLNYTTHDITVYLGNQDGTFRYGGTYSTGSDAFSLAAGDVNGDGVLDLVTSNFSTDSISVLLGRGDGTFGPPTLCATGSVPIELVLADFNGDGHLDVATSDIGSNQVSVLFGDGRGHFAPPVNYGVGVSPKGILAVDLNHDGHLDLAVADAQSNDLCILLNNGDGTFAPPVFLAAGSTPISVAAGDFTGNGNVDLAVSNWNDSTVDVYLGDGRGNFASPITIPTGFGPYQVLTGDFNHDGKIDLATVDLFGGTVTVLLGNGDGTFQQTQQISVDGYPTLGVAGDFHGSRNLDVIVGSSQASDLLELTGNGDGTFQSPLRVAVTNGPVALAAGDFNTDGSTDVVTADPTTETVAVSLGNGDGTFQTPTTIQLVGEPVAVTTGDFNRDGRPDLAVANYQTNSVDILLGIGDGTLQAPTSVAVGSQPDAVVAGDFNGDGITDLAVADYGSGTVTILLGRGDGTFVVGQQVQVGQGPVALAAGDFNGDGRIDLVAANRLSDSVSVLLGNGDGTFRVWTVALGTAPAAVVVGDFNGDGRLDIATADLAADAVSVLLGNGDGTFRPPVKYAVGTTPVALAVGDFDSDGRLDLAVADNNSGDVTVLAGRGDGTFQALAPVSVGAFPLALLAADFNGDGRADFATVNGEGQTVSVRIGLGDGTFFDPSKGSHPVHSTPLVADLNGDGVADVAILAGNGQILVRFGNPSAPGTFAPPVVLNPNPIDAARDLTVLTVNGRQELAALGVRSNSVCFYTYAGRSQFVRTRGPMVPTGMPVRIVAGDLNGDGRQDLVVAASTADTGLIDVYLQRPDGTFGPASYQLTAGVSPSDLALVSLAGGRGPDIVASDQYSGELRILQNGGAAPFSTQLAFTTDTGSYQAAPEGAALDVQSAAAPLAFVHGNFTGGAATDFLVLDSGTDRFALLAGDGCGGLFNPASATTFRTGSDPVALVAGDFNGDGIPDLAVLDRASAQVLVYLGDGRGGFVPHFVTGPDGQPLGLSAGNAPTSLAVADVNGDGHFDLLVGNANGDVLTLLGNGNGSFQPYQRLDRHVALAVGEFDNSTQLEFVFADQSHDQIVFQGDDPGSGFQQGRQDGVLSPNAVAVADLTGDGIPDLVVANGGGNDVLVYPGLGNNQFGPAQRFFVGTDPVGIAVADLNGDGIPDLVVANRGSNDVSILFGHGRGAAWTLEFGPRLQAGIGPDAVAVQDVYGNGIPDILVANSGSNDVYLLRGLGRGFFDDKNPVTFQTGVDPVFVYVGHFDAQGGLDLVTVNAGSDDLSVFAGFGAGRTVSLGGAAPAAAVASEFRGNGTDGLIVADRNGGFTLLEAGPSGLQVTAALAQSGLTNVSDVVLAGVNGDAVDLFVTVDGIAEAIPLRFALGITPTQPPDAPPSEPTPPGQGPSQPVTEFSAPSASPLEAVATLFLGAADAPPARPESAQAAALVRTGAAAEVVSQAPGGEEAEEGADAVPADHREDADVARNAAITGADQAPLLELLNGRPKAPEPAPDTTFPAPLDLFDGCDKFRAEGRGLRTEPGGEEAQAPGDDEVTAQAPGSTADEKPLGDSAESRSAIVFALGSCGEDRASEDVCGIIDSVWEQFLSPQSSVLSTRELTVALAATLLLRERPSRPRAERPTPRKPRA